MEEKEAELMDYLLILWRKKWVIILGIVFSVVLTGVVSLLLRPVYEVDAIVQPGKFFVQNEAGNIEQLVVEDPQQIADKVRHKSYDALIAAELKIGEEDLPTIRVESIRNTLLTRVWIRDADVDLSKKVLDSVIRRIQKDIDAKIDVEFNNLDSSIRAREIEKDRLTKQMEVLGQKLRIIDQRKRDIAAEMKATRNRVDEMEKEQLKVLGKEGRSEVETMGLLLYSNEIQQSLRYYDTLNEKLSEERIREEDINSEILSGNAEIGRLDTVIATLEQKKGRIDYTKVVKAPTASVDPVAPRAFLNVMVAAILSLLGFSVLVLLVENVHRYKRNNQPK